MSKVVIGGKSVSHIHLQNQNQNSKDLLCYFNIIVDLIICSQIAQSVTIMSVHLTFL